MAAQRKSKVGREQECWQDSPENDYKLQAEKQGMLPHRSSYRILFLKAVFCVALGVTFGVAFEKGRVFEPAILRQQMIFRKLIMIKMFLSALATGMFGLAIVAMLPFSAKRFYGTCGGYFADLSDKGILSSVIGGTVLGVGMTLSGSCPTSLFVQLGAAVPNAGYALIGAMLGTFVYGLVKPLLDKFLRPSDNESTNPWVDSPYFVMALPLAVMFGMLVVSFEMLKSWEKDVRIPDPNASLMEIKAWPPYVSGMIVGSLQVPLVLVLGESLGGSSSLLVVWAQVFVGPLRKLSPFIAKYRWGFNRWWQIFFVIGVILGAHWSAYSSYTLGIAKGVDSTSALVGGFMLFFGARIAGGCTSGHGLSGMSFHSILSFITVASMFAAAIVSAFIMNYNSKLAI